MKNNSENKFAYQNILYICTINQLKNKVMTKQQIGIFIKSVREQKGLTFYNVEKLSGVTNQVQKSIESATKDYTFGSLLKVCETLGIKLTWEIK